MIGNSDRYCKVIARTPEERSKAFSLISWIGKVCANRLIDEPYLDIFIVKSGQKNAQNCAVVKCPRGILYSIPHSILEPVEVKHTHSYGIDKDEILPEEIYVRIADKYKPDVYALLEWMGDLTAERIINEKKLEVRKKKSGIVGLEDCCVVECSRKYLLPIPTRILESLQYD